jgi:hypothetical protein
MQEYSFYCGLADGLIQALPRLIEKIPVIIEKLITAITNNLPKIVEARNLTGIKINRWLDTSTTKTDRSNSKDNRCINYSYYRKSA